MTTDNDSESTYFSVDILFSEALHFGLDEIVEAINEDYPSCQVKDSGLSPSNSLKTDEVVLAVLEPAEPQDSDSITLTGIGFPDEEFRNADHTESLWRSGGFGKDAIAGHKSYLTVSLKSADGTLASRFRAARMLNVVTAVFAKLPITMAVYVKWNGLFARPEQWAEAADEAVKGNWPLLAWISYRAGWDTGPGRSSDFAVGYTTGLKQFLPYELHMEAAPIQPTDVIQMLAGAVWMPLQGGSVYENGHTVGPEEGTRYVIRERRDAQGEFEGVMVLLHPDTPIDEAAEFGERRTIPTPMEEPYVRHPKKGFMQRILGRN